jgi:hypothetical protein
LFDSPKRPQEVVSQEKLDQLFREQRALFQRKQKLTTQRNEQAGQAQQEMAIMETYPRDYHDELLGEIDDHFRGEKAFYLD